MGYHWRGRLKHAPSTDPNAHPFWRVTCIRLVKNWFREIVNGSRAVGPGKTCKSCFATFAILALLFLFYHDMEFPRLSENTGSTLSPYNAPLVLSKGFASSLACVKPLQSSSGRMGHRPWFFRVFFRVFFVCLFVAFSSTPKCCSSFPSLGLLTMAPRGAGQAVQSNACRSNVAARHCTRFPSPGVFR